MSKKKQAQKALKEKRVETTRQLACILTQEEFNARAQSLTESLHECSRIEREAKSVSKDFASRLAGAEATAARLNNIVHDKTEFRDVKCQEIWDYENGEYRLGRLDTGEVVESRPLRNDEKFEQLTLTENDMETVGAPADAEEK